MSQLPQWGVPPTQGPQRFDQPYQQGGPPPARGYYGQQLPSNASMNYQQSYPSSPNPSQRGKTGIIICIVVALILLLGGGTFFIIKSQKDEEPEVFSPDGRPYSFSIPKGLTRVDIETEGLGFEAEPDIQFSLTSHAGKGGSVIQVGVTSGGMADQPIDEISSVIAEDYAELEQYDTEGGGAITRSDTMVDGFDADVIEMKSVKNFLGLGDFSTYTRFYLIATNSNGPVIYISCDWNDNSNNGTQAIDSICTSLAQSIKIRD